MPVRPTFVIVGASLAGATAAATLREDGFEGRVVLVGAEPFPPYERPPLSKELLRGERSLEAGLVRPADWYEEHEIEARFGEVVDRLDVSDRSIGLTGGQHVRFDSALIATGVRNRRLHVPGADLPGVFDLRTASDARRIREAASGASRALIVGMGFIGAEVAASLRTMGLEVTVVEFFGVPLYRALGGEIGSVFARMHTDHGIQQHFNDSVERFEGDGRMEAVITRSGLRIEADFAVVGVGTEPASEVARELTGSGGGIEVDSALQTRAAGVFAAGDVAAHDHPLFGRLRVEHFDNAIKMGRAAARNMLGRREPFDDPHWFWSDQYDSNLQVAGFTRDWDERVVRGSLEERSFAMFFLRDGVLRQTVTLDRPRDARRSLPLILAEVRPDLGALADPDVDLRTLAPPAAA
jgi:3-phenylpropionate/trans-cinnamate dioxygenase ferredoxin reductase subunit